MRVTDKPVRHLTNDGSRCSETRAPWSEVRAEADCDCGTNERHTHCASCGALASVGDWDAEPIATHRWSL